MGALSSGTAPIEEPPRHQNGRALSIASTRFRTFLVALALDAAFGDPPTAVHPVRWIGRIARAFEARVPPSGAARRCWGVAGAIGLPLFASLTARVLLGRSDRAGMFRIMRAAVALETTFALRTLLARAAEVHAALDANDLPGARELLARHLVSRDTSDLSAAEVAGATIESVAENLSDGVVGPWLTYAAAGVPGAFAYRAVNTLDSMWGYRTEQYAAFGWAAARIDDGANWLPARATALAILGASRILGGSEGNATLVWQRDAGNTESPNAGHPMAAMAGALGVMLTKRGAYTLGAGGRDPEPRDIVRAVRIARVAASLVAAVLAGLIVVTAPSEERDA